MKDIHVAESRKTNDLNVKRGVSKYIYMCFSVGWWWIGGDYLKEKLISLFKNVFQNKHASIKRPSDCLHLNVNNKRSCFFNRKHSKCFFYPRSNSLFIESKLFFSTMLLNAEICLFINFIRSIMIFSTRTNFYSSMVHFDRIQKLETIILFKL